MMIVLRSITHRLNEQGLATQIEAVYNSYENGQDFRATVILTEEHVDLERANKIQIDNIARREIRNWTLEKPENLDDVEENTEETPDETEET